ncbi:MAG: [FeFe] hydrogenase H-cluster radical SAM maturase HydE [Candidatus Kaelpia imicola]|nr:[FeFe] hydrogenase H-cluster radical SAM maturase HydE [Candidatus Kaelpia imicola]
MKNRLSKNEIKKFLKGEDENHLLETASNIRKEFFKKKVLIRAIIAFSNYCLRDCLYCGLRISNKKLRRYRMRKDEIVGVARGIIEKGIKTIVLQSGDDLYYSRDNLVNLIVSIKRFSPSLALTLSIGERPLDDYKAFYDAGADRYLIKHETANESLYNKLHPNQSFKERVEIIEFLRKIGYQVGLGNIIGLPGQSLKDLAADIMFYQDFQPDMIGLGPFISAVDTPLSAQPSPDMKLVLRSYALARVVTVDSHIPLTTAAMTKGENDFMRESLKVSTNVIMVDFTPKEYSLSYKIYDNRSISSIREIDYLIKKLGFTPSYVKGDSLKRF